MNKVPGEQMPSCPFPGWWGRDALGWLLCPSLLGYPWHSSQGKATSLMTIVPQTSSATPTTADCRLNLVMQDRALRGDKEMK